jgi:hypothetical protein
LRDFVPVYPFLSPLFAPRQEDPKRAASGTNSVRTRVRLTTGATHGRLDVIVARRVLQREGAGTAGRLVALLWALRRTQRFWSPF